LLDKNDLINFENKIATLFNEAKIRAPIHLYSNNEEQMIDIFKTVNKDDWVFCSWRSHYQCLLKGVPAMEIEQRIVNGKSISLCFPEYKIYSSAIVGGVLPISVGAALSIKTRGSAERVHCFVGEMTAETGIAHECIKYSIAHDLPIRFIIEDNGKSVMTDTREVWSLPKLSYEECQSEKIIYYKYDLKFPHAGAGVRVQF